MQTITPQKYPFFRNQNHKKRSKTIQSTQQQQYEQNNLKQSTPIMIRRRNYLKDPSNEKPARILDFRTKKVSVNLNQSYQPDSYKKYTQQFTVPKLPNGGNTESLEQITQVKKEQKPRIEQSQLNSSQQNNLIAIKRGALSNNKSYDPSKRTAVFTRKSVYSINSFQKEKKSPSNYYPSKILSKEGYLLEIKDNPKSFPSNIKQKQSQHRLHSKKNSFSISRNRYLLPKQQKFYTNSRTNIRLQSKRPRYHSTSQTQIIDSNFDRLIKKQFSSISVKQLNNDPVIRNHLDPMYLTEFQKQEIKNYKDIFYIGHKAYLRKYKEQLSFRDQKNNYKPIIGDHIAYRFEIVKILGSGAFGKVLEVIDHKQPAGTKKKNYALKILKKSQDLYEQFKLQIKILKIVKQNYEAVKNIVEIKGDFQFRNHICIVTELLDLNVYSFIKNQQFQGLSIQITRKIMIQVLQALLFLHNKHIVHCDIKPQNIVFKEEGKSGVKLIDFGSACFADKKQFTYIQSRYYRSPQIVLVKPYDEKIDVWSAGCLAFQMFTGSPLFPARCEEEQIQMLKQTLGAPPALFLGKCQRADQFAFQNQLPIFPLSKRIEAAKTSQAFLNFLQRMIRWSPEERMTVKQALTHEFILQGLPDKVKKQHISQMKSSNPYGLFQGW